MHDLSRSGISLTRTEDFLFPQLRLIEEVKALGPITVKKLGFHPRLSIDDLAAAVNMYLHPGSVFNIPADLTMEFYGRGEIEEILSHYGGCTVRFLIETGTLIIGMAGSFLDEHEHHRNGYRRPPNHCAASLTALLTGMDQDPYWQQVLEFVLCDDLGERFDHTYLDASMTLPNLLKYGYSADKQNAPWVISYGMKFVEVYYRALKSGRFVENGRPNWSIDFLVELADAEWANRAKVLFIEAAQIVEQRVTAAEHGIKTLAVEYLQVSGGKLGVCVIENDLENFQKRVFDKRSDIDILIMRRETGNVQIFTRRGKAISLAKPAGIIRQMEMKARGRTHPIGVDFTQPGSILGCQEWFLFQPKNSDMLFNGSLTAPDTPPTRLANDDILKAVTLGLKYTRQIPQRFDRPRKHAPQPRA
jgi:hypothetical protein